MFELPFPFLDATNRHAVKTWTFALLSLWVCAGCVEIDALTPPPGAPNIDLRLEQTANFASRTPGEQVVFSVRVRNLGPRIATGILAGDTLPTGLTLVTHTSTHGTYETAGVNRGLWTIGSLNMNEEAILTLRTNVDQGVSPGTLANRAGVLSTEMNDTVPENNIAIVLLNVTPVIPPPPPPVGVIFSSDWSTALGSSDNAITDGGRWTDFYCQDRAQILDVVPGGPVGWTKTANVLRVTQRGLICGGITKANAIPVSTSHYGRMYFRNDETASQHNHVMTYNALGDIQTAFWNRGGSGSSMRIFMRTYYYGNGQGAVYPTNFWSPTTFLPNGVWYRFEWHMQYITPTSYRIWPRVYNAANQLILDANTYFENDATAGSGRTLAAWYAAGNTFGFSNVQLARNIGLGNEGSGGTPNNGQFWYHADMVISTSGWIGQ